MCDSFLRSCAASQMLIITGTWKKPFPFVKSCSSGSGQGPCAAFQTSCIPGEAVTHPSEPQARLGTATPGQHSLWRTMGTFSFSSFLLSTQWRNSYFTVRWGWGCKLLAVHYRLPPVSGEVENSEAMLVDFVHCSQQKGKLGIALLEIFSVVKRSCPSGSLCPVSLAFRGGGEGNGTAGQNGPSPRGGGSGKMIHRWQ